MNKRVAFSKVMKNTHSLLVIVLGFLHHVNYIVGIQKQSVWRIFPDADKKKTPFDDFFCIQKITPPQCTYCHIN